ncbi:head-tail connector protein [Rhizobium oryziradicis]|nr:head-tail connector protein [Rhizobium oryziradicis]
MLVSVIEPPTAVVTVDEARAHLRLDHTDDDGLLETLIKAATGWIDGPAGWLGRCIGGQVLEMRLARWPSRGSDLPLPYPPVVQIEQVAHLGSDGNEQPVSDTLYRLAGNRLWLMPDFVAPVGGDEPYPVRIRYWAGYGAMNAQGQWENDAPATIKAAILMLVGQWYANPEAVATATSNDTMPFAVEALLQPYRVLS